jgi:uncharacterized protein YndB with AHSA1/START domain
MNDQLVATASVRVPVDPERAFDVFANDISKWWPRGTRYWNDKELGLKYDFVDGMLLEVFTEGEPFQVGRVLRWEPGSILEFIWRQRDWVPGDETTVTVTFTAESDGTLVSVSHRGWESLAPESMAQRQGYKAGWTELLGYYVQEVAA